MLTFAAQVACLLVSLLVCMPLAGRAVLVVLVDVLAVVFALCPLLAHVTVAFGGSVGADRSVCCPCSVRRLCCWCSIVLMV